MVLRVACPQKLLQKASKAGLGLEQKGAASYDSRNNNCLRRIDCFCYEYLIGFRQTYIHLSDPYEYKVNSIDIMSDLV